jgi:hypothetical protein
VAQSPSDSTDLRATISNGQGIVERLGAEILAGFLIATARTNAPVKGEESPWGALSVSARARLNGSRFIDARAIV